jgi:hypothetical protein
MDERIASFAEAALSQGNMTKGNHIMMTMGGDFQYESSTEVKSWRSLYMYRVCTHSPVIDNTPTFDNTLTHESHPPSTARINE